MIHYIIYLHIVLCSIQEIDEEIVNKPIDIDLDRICNEKEPKNFIRDINCEKPIDDTIQTSNSTCLASNDINPDLCSICEGICSNSRKYQKCLDKEECIVCNKIPRPCLKYLQSYVLSRKRSHSISKTRNESKKVLIDVIDPDKIVCKESLDAIFGKYQLISGFLNGSPELKKILKEYPNMPITFEEIKLLNPTLLNSLIEIIKFSRTKNFQFVNYEAEMVYIHFNLDEISCEDLFTDIFLKILNFNIIEIEICKFKEILNEISHFLYNTKFPLKFWPEDKSHIKIKLEELFNSYNLKYFDLGIFRIRSLIFSIYINNSYLNTIPKRDREMYMLLILLEKCENEYIRLFHKDTLLNTQDNRLKIQNIKLDFKKKINEIMFRIVSCIQYNTNYYVSFDLLKVLFEDITNIIHTEKNNELKYANRIFNDFHLILFLLPDIFIEKLNQLTEIILYMIIIGHREDTIKLEFIKNFENIFFDILFKETWDNFVIRYIYFLIKCELLISLNHCGLERNIFKYQIGLKILNNNIEPEYFIYFNNSKYIVIFKDYSGECFKSISEYIHSNLT
ncbi:hypothetical protein LUQ84_002023 [Hamiltosporidium tvaerminnensis]|nr:hypothetical protein LUQ84_002023 [Hamiltosporidium tvaerminnensis]